MPQLKVSEAEREFFLTQPFVLCRPLTDWMRPTHTGEGNLLYSVYNSNFNLIQNTLADTPRNTI